MRLRLVSAGLAVLTGTLLGCGGGGDFQYSNLKPSYLGNVQVTSYDGGNDDLLTAGLGWQALQVASPPALTVSTPATAAELRRLAIHSNYRALVDTSTNGGYGVLYGPNVSLSGAVDATPTAGKVAGTEYLSYTARAGRVEATHLVQIPSNFNTTRPCIVTATSSGSRGVYGAVSAAGEWGLKRGCAVAYTDKGTGNGAHELRTDTITRVDGTTADADLVGDVEHFEVELTDAERIAFNDQYPNRYAFKHAHSQANPEQDWGRFTLQAVEFAFWAINEKFAASLSDGRKARDFTATNTLVIAASVSNGGGAALMAAEQDTDGLIDAVVVGEPQISLRMPAGTPIGILRGGGASLNSAAVGRPLYDYVTIANLLQPCAAIAPSVASSPIFPGVVSATARTLAEGRCTALRNDGWINGSTPDQQSEDALLQLRAAGWEPASELLHHSHYFSNATPAVAVTYANAYAQASVADLLCGYSFATISSTTFRPATPAAPGPMNTLFGLGNGVPPTNGIQLVFQDAVNNAIDHQLALGDMAYDGADCLRALWTATSAPALTLRSNVDQIKVGANLRGKPAIILHGRSDALVPVNFTSRPYFGANKVVEGSRSKLSYIEVTNAQHFDAFIGAVAGYETLFVPLHYYNLQALNLMWDHLTAGGTLPASQVVHTVPRTAGSSPLSVAANLPPIVTTPAAGDAITFNANNRTVLVPN